MKKAVIKKLKEIAATLPPVMEPKPLQKTGKEIKESNPKHSRDTNGKNLKDNANYTTMSMQPVDHLNKLKAAWTKGGEVEVTKYSVWATHKNAEQMKQASKPKTVNTI